MVDMFPLRKKGSAKSQGAMCATPSHTWFRAIRPVFQSKWRHRQSMLHRQKRK